MLEPLAGLGSLSSSGEGQRVPSQEHRAGLQSPAAPGTQRKLLWPEASPLFGVSVRKLREPYLWFQQAASLHKVTISFLDPQGHLLKAQPWESSCEIQRDWTRRLLDSDQL